MLGEIETVLLFLVRDPQADKRIDDFEEDQGDKERPDTDRQRPE